jgi:hypothetical protein
VLQVNQGTLPCKYTNDSIAAVPTDVEIDQVLHDLIHKAKLKVTDLLLLLISQSLDRGKDPLLLFVLIHRRNTVVL